MTAPERTGSKKWGAMSHAEKLGFVGKACVFFLSWGFVFPNLFEK